MKNDKLQIIDIFWFNQINTKSIIGIVKCKNIETNKIQIYMGIIDYPFKENFDVIKIINYGNKINQELLKNLLNKGD